MTPKASRPPLCFVAFTIYGVIPGTEIDCLPRGLRSYCVMPLDTPGTAVCLFTAEVVVRTLCPGARFGDNHQIRQILHSIQSLFANNRLNFSKNMHP